MLTIIPITENKKWDEIVKSFKDYDIYYLSGYSRAFQIHGDGTPQLFYYTNDDIRAINVVIVKDISYANKIEDRIPKESYFDLVTVYGYGGFIIEGTTNEDDIKKLDLEYTQFCKSNRIVSEFVRFNPITENNIYVQTIYSISSLGKTVSMKLSSKEQIWNDLTSKNRNMVRKAQKAGVEIYFGRDQMLFKEFIDMYKGTMDKDNAKDYYYFGDAFYQSIISDLSSNSLIFYAKYKEKIISMSIILFANKNVHYHLSASIKEFNHYAPTNLLLFEVACWGCENGYKEFHLGGGLGSCEDNLYKFKSGFNRHGANIFSVGKKIFDEITYCELIKISKSETSRFTPENVETSVDCCKNEFFPEYRAE